MNNILKSFLITAICSLFFFQANEARGQSKDNDVLVMEVSSNVFINTKEFGIYLFWPDRDVEFISIEVKNNSEGIMTISKTLYRKINELADLGWDLTFIHDTYGKFAYYFKRIEVK